MHTTAELHCRAQLGRTRVGVVAPSAHLLVPSVPASWTAFPDDAATTEVAALAPAADRPTRPPSERFP